MPPETSTSVYDLIANQLINMGPNAFGNASFGLPTDDGQSPHFFRTLHNKNISYVWNRDGANGDVSKT